MKNRFFLLLVVLISVSCAPKKVVAEAAPAKVVVVKTPPRSYRVVRINGKRYYQWNGKRYRKTRRGYVLVKNY